MVEGKEGKVCETVEASSGLLGCEGCMQITFSMHWSTKQGLKVLENSKLTIRGQHSISLL